MAVKYSKQRDFGAKHRKTRKMGKKMWTLKSVHKLKSNAKKRAVAWRRNISTPTRASSWRRKGYMARVVKLLDGYGVYTHTK